MTHRSEYRRYGIPVKRKALPALLFAALDAIARAKNAMDIWRARRGKGRS